VLQAGSGRIDLGKTYEALKFPGMLDTQRRWQRHPEWTDVYRHLLPRGPAPSRNESVYLLRAIRTRRDITVDVVYRSEDFLRFWLNEAVIGTFLMEPNLYKGSRVPRTIHLRLALPAGENRLLVKHTSMHNAHGFAFNVPALSGQSAPDEEDLTELVNSKVSRFTSADVPYASAQANQVKTPLQTANGGVDSPRHVADALARVKAFRFDVAPMPMYDPPRLSIHELLEQTVPHTPGAQAYLDRLSQLEPQVRTAREAALRGMPQADAAVVRAAEAIEGTWREQIQQLPPVVFIRRLW
jgi:hypothetical protein